MLTRILCCALSALLITAPAAAQVEATSLLGEPLKRPPLSEDARGEFEAKLASTEAKLDAAPQDLNAAVWKGRYLGYLGRYRDAIDWYTEAMRRHPNTPELLRHRGHRYISVREFEKAVDDLERASELMLHAKDRIEPDGLPNSLGLPRGTLKFNIEYHLALAEYLQGEYGAALEASDRCAEPAMRNDDVYVAWANWRYHILRRLGRDAEAMELARSIPAEMNLIENFDYHALLRAYASGDPDALRDPLAEREGLAAATQAYGLAAYLLAEGRREEAVERMERIVELPGWAAFGVIAAEADLARLRSDSEAAER